MNENKILENVEAEQLDEHGMNAVPEQLDDVVIDTPPAEIPAENEQIADDTDIETKPAEDTSAIVPEQSSSKKPRTKRTKKSDNTAKTSDIPESSESKLADTKEESTPEKKYHTGDAVDISLALLYRSSVAPKHFKGIHGKYYIWNDAVVNGRIRLTNSPSGVGRQECIIGWIDFKNIQ